MILLKSIHLINFLSHSDTKIEINSTCKLLIDGKSGSGKSAIVDAVLFSLYNKSRSDGRSLIKHGEKTAKVTVILSDEKGNEYEVIRSITSKGKHTLLILKQGSPITVTGTRGQQEYLENELLKSSYLLFINSVIYPQDNVENFVKQTAAKRKEIILEIARASNYDEYYKKTSDKITELNSKIMHNDDVVLMLEDSIALDRASADKDYVLKATYKTIEDKLKLNKVVLEEITAKVNDAKINNARKLDKEVLLTSLQARIAGYKKEMHLASGNLDKINSVSTLNQKENRDELAKLVAAKQSLFQWNTDLMKLSETKPYFTDNNDVHDIAEQIDKEMNEEVSMCPEIGRICPTIEKARTKKINELERLLKKASDDKNEYNRKVIEYNKKVTDLGSQPIVDHTRIEELTKLVEMQVSQELQSGAIKSIIANGELQISELSSQVMGLKIEIENLTAKIVDTYDLVRKKGILENESTALLNEFTDLTVKLREIEIAIKRLEINEKKLKEVVDDNREAKALLEAMICLKSAFGNTGIKAIIVDWLIPRLEDRINEILSKLSDFRLHLDTQKKSVSGESMIEGLHINIMNERGEGFNFDNFSGGERVKVSAAIFEGLASFQHCGFRLLDESIVSLDSESTSQFLEVLENVQKKVDQLIVISHIQEVKQSFENKIEIIKINGESKIK